MSLIAAEAYETYLALYSMGKIHSVPIIDLRTGHFPACLISANRSIKTPLFRELHSLLRHALPRAGSRQSNLDLP